MPNSHPINEILTDTISDIDQGKNPNNLSLESLALLINSERLRSLENKITTEFIEIKKRHNQVSLLHKLIKGINSATHKDEFDCSSSPELQNLLTKAKEYGVELQDGKYKYSKDERERLIENIKITVDDYNILNDMQLQTITRMTTERYESYQLARSIIKPLHEDKTNKARAAAGK